MTTLSGGLPLYTSDTQILESANTGKPANLRVHRGLDEVAFKELYEIDRTVEEITAGGYKRVALQFPDELLGDSTRVYELILEGINRVTGREPRIGAAEKGDKAESGGVKCNREGNCATDTLPKPTHNGGTGAPEAPSGAKASFILADTSYSACCIDEIAAEHCAADVLVHYGHSCLSPTTRLPVIYVFNSNPLDLTHAAGAFCNTFSDKSRGVIVMADVTYSSHVVPLHRILHEMGYTNVYPTEVIHDPSAQIPNRSLPPDFLAKEGGEGGLKAYSLFHISPPLPSLLLVLTSRVHSIHTYDTTTTPPTCNQETTSVLLRRRYALLSHARSANVIGILVNTLNVKNYLPVISMLKRQIRDAGRKSYLVVVGRVNVEKVANFAEVEVWVGVGCWEQGIVGGGGEGSGRGFFRGVVTPFEIGIALSGKDGWEWTGRWVSDFESLLKMDGDAKSAEASSGGEADIREERGEEEGADEEEDEPPEFDLRTGQYVATARPMRRKPRPIKHSQDPPTPSSALIHASNSSKQLGGAVGGVVSPAAQFLKDKRSWRGLGSDILIRYEEDENKNDGFGAVVEVGRSGVARGYTVGGEGERR
ncbi:diphthamide biosynthesis protein [Tuber magnatum]|uniref:2-(3-amino-3-carboxypropyl)histidine synthase subunit 2 n=1 Tax=Tuber magnatum TaxID=42249 RepID=A0A317SNB0_9PEZI|nr:diphthamide biosynthesis protein [Tuber magnatum]